MNRSDCRCRRMRGRDRDGGRAGMAGPAADHGGAVRGRRRRRRHGTHPGAAPVGAPGPAGDRRECRRRRRHDRHQPGGESRPRRLSVRARQRRHPCLQPDALQEPALQRGDRFRAGRADRRDAAACWWRARICRPTTCASSSPTRRRTRPGCNTARPEPARRPIWPARCSMRSSASTSRTFPIAARRRPCRI